MSSAMKTIAVENAPKAIGPYAQGIVAGGFLFTAGQVPLDPATMTLVRGTIAVMRLMLRRLVANWDGNHRKRLRAGFVKQWNGTCPIQNGLIM